LRAYFLAGILVTAPISITLYLAYLLFRAVDEAVTALLPPQFNPETYLPDTWSPIGIPGIGLVILVVGLTLIGWLTAGFIGRLFLRVSEGLLARIPAVRSLYGAVKQILETVLANQSSAFREVVLVEYPRRGMWVIGFITGNTEGEVQNLTEDTLINIFVPTTPNPTSGFLIFVPKGDVTVLDMSVEEGIKMVVSAGIVTPPDKRAEAEQAAPAIAARAEGKDIAIEEAATRAAKGDRPARRKTG
jgi:uncharacterized membrane protein